MKRILSTCGLDEAGRGPVFGPLVVAALVCPTTALPELVELGVRDSKALAPARRERVYEALVARSDVQYQTVHISSEDIDLRRTRGESLNEIELAAFTWLARAVLQRRQPACWVNRFELDSLERDAAKFAARFREGLPTDLQEDLDVVCETGADITYACVSAASIIAKVERDRAVAAIAAREGCAVGSGYTHDQITKAFLEAYYVKHGRLPPYCRHTWRMTNQPGFAQ